ncbi:MAG: hypothetical protein ACYSUM_19655 [Planctomycetota bacterium]
MRPIAVLLLVAVAVSAQDPFAESLKRFERAAAGIVEPGAQAKVYPAIEDLVATGDVRAVKPLLSLLVATFEAENGLFKTNKELRRRGADAVDRAKTLDGELQFLHLKEKAGDKSVGPEIQKRVEERTKQSRLFDQMRGETVRIGRTIDFVRDVREKLAAGCAHVLKGLEGDQLTAGLNGARQVLDIANHEQVLFLVRVLRGSGSKQAEPHLLEVFAHPKVDDAVVRAAQYAVAPLMSRRGAEALLQVWERDPEGRGKHARHALSLAARRNLADLETARAWVKSLDG